MEVNGGGSTASTEFLPTSLNPRRPGFSGCFSSTGAKATCSPLMVMLASGRLAISETPNTASKVLAALDWVMYTLSVEVRSPSRVRSSQRTAAEGVAIEKPVGTIFPSSSSKVWLRMMPGDLTQKSARCMSSRPLYTRAAMWT